MRQRKNKSEKVIPPGLIYTIRQRLGGKGLQPAKRK